MGNQKASEVGCRSFGARQSLAHTVFIRRSGLRAGWRLAVFLLIDCGLTIGAQLGLAEIPRFHAWVLSLPRGVMTPAQMFAYEGLELLILAISTLMMCAIEQHGLDDGLPFR